MGLFCFDGGEVVAVLERLPFFEHVFYTPGMGWQNPEMPWRELERRLSGRPPTGDGGDSPAWSHKRDDYEPRRLPRPR